MNRTWYRMLTWLAVCLATATAFGDEAVSPGKKTDRPNILFCFADDWGRYASIYGELESRMTVNQIIKTPHIDRVARHGILFRNAFVNAPSCTPCRSSLLSGRYFFRTGRGANLQGAEWDSAIPSFPLLLHDSGYHVGETYKVWSPGTPNDGPFGAGQFAYEKAGGQFNNFSENVTRLVGQGISLKNATQRMMNCVQGNFEAFLAARPAGQPFLYWFGPTNVHRMWAKGSGQALWGIDPDSLKGRLPQFLPDVPEIREDFADYLGEIQAFDTAIGVLLKRLEDAGELERTLIVISGDHGAPGFPGGKCNLYDFGVGVSLMMSWPGQSGAGRVVDDFVNLMDLCPTFLEVAGVTAPEGINGRSLVPLIKSDKSGQVDPSRTWVICGRERHVAAARDDNLPYPQRSLRTPDYLYIRNFKPDRWPLGSPQEVTDTQAPAVDVLETNTHVAFPDMDASPTKAWLIQHRNDPAWRWHYDYAFARRPGEELFDLKQDPDQMKNVANDPAYAEVRKKLSDQLLQTLNKAADPRVTGDGETFDRPPFTDPNPPAAAKKAQPKAAAR